MKLKCGLLVMLARLLIIGRYTACLIGFVKLTYRGRGHRQVLAMDA